jgi:hypothetical protein
MLAAVDGKRRAGDKIRIICYQKDHAARDVLGMP